MRMQFMLKAAQQAGLAARALEKLAHRGHCTVLEVKCNLCERWVKPEDWNPSSAVCDDCTSYLAIRTAVIRKPVRWIATGKGKLRKQTGVK